MKFIEITAVGRDKSTAKRLVNVNEILSIIDEPDGAFIEIRQYKKIARTIGFKVKETYEEIADRLDKPREFY